MHNNESQKIFNQINKIFKRRKLVILFCIVGILAPIIYFNETSSPIYEASTMVVFEEFSGAVSGYNYDASREVLIFNRLEEIKSLAFAEEVTNSLDENTVARVSLPEVILPDFDLKTYISTRLQKSISAMPVSKSNIVRLSVQWVDPQLASTLANTAASIFLDRNYRIRQEGASSVREFLEAQLERVRTELQSAEQSLKIFKEDHRITSFNRESEEILRRLTEAENLYNQVKSSRESNEVRLRSIQDKINQQKQDFVPSITDLGSSWTGKLRQKLIDLQSDLADLKVQGYDDDHARVRQLTRDLEETKQALTSEAQKQVQSGTFGDPQVQLAQFVNELFTLQIEMEALKAQESAFKKIIDQYEENLGSLPDKEYNLLRLTRERDAKSTTYLTLLGKLQDAKIQEAEKVSSIRVIDRARVPEKPIKPRKKLNITIGVLLGAIIGFGIAFVLETYNKSVDSTEELEALTEWPVLASIPKIEKAAINATEGGRNGLAEGQKGYISSLNPKSNVAETYRMLRTNLQFHGVGQSIKTIMFTSIGPDEGKSTTVANLSISLAGLGLRVCVIDADLRKPVMHSFFNVDKEPGLSELLVNHNLMNSHLSLSNEQKFLVGNMVKDEGMGDLVDNFSDFILEDQLVTKISNKNGMKHPNLIRNALLESIQVTEHSNLTVLTSGKQLRNPSEMVSSKAMRTTLDQVRGGFDVVLVDTAPIMLVPETMVLSALADGIVFVVDSRKFEREILLKAKRLLQKADANVLGTVLNYAELNGIYKTDYYYQA